MKINEIRNKFSAIKNKMSLYLDITTDCILLKKIKGNYKCTGLNSFHFEDISIFSEDCDFVETSFVDSVFERCTFDVNAFHNVTFTGCKFINCNVRTNSSTSNNIHCYGCDDYNTGFISSLTEVIPSSVLQKTRKYKFGN